MNSTVPLIIYVIGLLAFLAVGGLVVTAVLNNQLPNNKIKRAGVRFYKIDTLPQHPGIVYRYKERVLRTIPKYGFKYIETGLITSTLLLDVKRNCIQYVGEKDPRLLDAIDISLVDLLDHIESGLIAPSIAQER